MKRLCSILFLILIITTTFFGANQKMKRIIVFDFEAIDVDDAVAFIVTDGITSALSAYEHFRVIERLQINAILDEMELSSSDDFDDTLKVKVGMTGEADLIVTGSVTVFDEKFVITMRLINVKTGEVLLRKEATGATLNELSTAIATICEEISTLKIAKRQLNRVVILPLVPVNQPLARTTALTETFIAKLGGEGTYHIITEEKRDTILNEQYPDQKHLTREHLQALGKILGADLVITGEVTKKKGRNIITIKGIRVIDGLTVYTKSVSTSKTDELPTALDELVKIIFEKRHNVVDLDVRRRNKQIAELLKRQRLYEMGKAAKIVGPVMLGLGLNVLVWSGFFYEFAYNITLSGYDQSYVPVMLGVGGGLSALALACLSFGIGSLASINVIRHKHNIGIVRYESYEKLLIATMIVTVSSVLTLANIGLYFVNTIWQPLPENTEREYTISLGVTTAIGSVTMTAALIMGIVTYLDFIGLFQQFRKTSRLYPILGMNNDALICGVGLKLD